MDSHLEAACEGMKQGAGVWEEKYIKQNKTKQTHAKNKTNN